MDRDWETMFSPEKLDHVSIKVDNEVEKKYLLPYKREAAYKSSRIMKQYLSELPIGWTPDCTKKEYYKRCFPVTICAIDNRDIGEHTNR